MSTPYNNQWVLRHARSRWRRRTSPAGSGALGQPPVPLPHEPHGPHERQASPAPERPRPAFRRPARKRPRWIDRDT